MIPEYRLLLSTSTIATICESMVAATRNRITSWLELRVGAVAVITTCASAMIIYRDRESVAILAQAVWGQVVWGLSLPSPPLCARTQLFVSLPPVSFSPSAAMDRTGPQRARDEELRQFGEQQAYLLIAQEDQAKAGNQPGLPP